MSRINFHTPNKTIWVSGSERYIMRKRLEGVYQDVFLCDNIQNKTEGIIAVYEDDEIRRLKQISSDTGEGFITWIKMIGVMLRSKEVRVMGDSFISVLANTAIATHFDPLILCARIYGQCELHGYVEGKNRNWLASQIEQCIKINYFQEKESWQKVIELLTEDDLDPVVTSYSVSGIFPNALLVGWDDNKWVKLTQLEQWNEGLLAIRDSQSKLEFNPETWNDFYFERGWDANKITEVFSRCVETHQPITPFIYSIRDYYNSLEGKPEEKWAKTRIFISEC